MRRSFTGDAPGGQLNRGCCYREQVGSTAATMTALDYLVASRRHSTRATWATRFASGEIELDGARASEDARLHPGQVLTWHRPPWIEPDVPRHFDVLLEDDAVIAVDKPSGLPTMPAGGFLEHTLLAFVQARWPDAHPVHRLGRHTSGVVVFARTPAAAAALGRAWRAHEVTKAYRALASGVIEADRFDINTPIGPVPHPRLGHVHAASPSGRPAHSHVSVLERRAATTLARVHITTGRPHQIRIHLAAAGHPLAGDPLYGAGGRPRDDHPGLPGDGGYLLHAEHLAFVHPRTGAPVVVHATPPPDLRAATE